MFRRENRASICHCVWSGGGSGARDAVGKLPPSSGRLPASSPTSSVAFSSMSWLRCGVRGSMVSVLATGQAAPRVAMRGSTGVSTPTIPSFTVTCRSLARYCTLRR